MAQMMLEPQAVDATPNPADLLIRFNPQLRPRLRLFCFPFAGGDANFFRSWAAEMPAGVEIVGVQYPGRDVRSPETAIADCSEMVRILRRAIQPLLQEPFMFFGHSNGALISFELARSLDIEHRKRQRHHFLSARRPAHLDNGGWRISHLADADFIRELGYMGGTPTELLGNDELMRLFIPRLRADLALGEDYVFVPGPLLECDVTTLQGADDPVIDGASVPRWAELTHGRTFNHVLPGTHFFIHSAKDRVIAILKSKIDNPISDGKSLMASDIPPPPFSFELFYTTVNAYFRTAALKAAIELGVFDSVGERGKTVTEIARDCSSSERGVRVLCRFLVSIGFMKKREEEFFLSRDMLMFLSRKSPGYLGDSIDFLLSPYIMSAFTDLTSVVRTGAINLTEDGVVADDHPQWVAFARAMERTMSLPSMLLAEVVDPRPSQPIKVLDLAAGHGLFGIEVLRRNPQAHVTFVDWGNVLEVVKDNARNAGVLDRATFLPGSAFDVEFGERYDVVLLTNFLHHFNEADCVTIAKKARSALVEGGRALTFEFIANEDRISPPLALTFSMMMLGTTPEGEVYSFSDLERIYRTAGYNRTELRPIPPAMEKVAVSYR